MMANIWRMIYNANELDASGHSWAVTSALHSFVDPLYRRLCLYPRSPLHYPSLWVSSSWTFALFFSLSLLLSFSFSLSFFLAFLPQRLFFLYSLWCSVSFVSAHWTSSAHVSVFPSPRWRHRRPDGWPLPSTWPHPRPRLMCISPSRRTLPPHSFAPSASWQAILAACPCHALRARIRFRPRARSQLTRSDHGEVYSGQSAS